MAGTWNSQNKILPGAYINFLTNKPLSITPGERGTVLLLQEMSVGSKGELYTVTATESDYPAGVSSEDIFLAGEALKGAQVVKVYNLGQAHENLTDALTLIKTVDFDVVVYPYDGTGYESNKTALSTWIKAMVGEEGKGIQGVLANFSGDSENIINVAQGVKLSDGSILTPGKVTAWVAGVTAGASVSRSNTGKKYAGAIDVVPRMTKTEMEAAVTAGKFIFKVDTVQNVTAVYDINSLITITATKGKAFKKNRVVRTLTGINNDITEIFEANYVGTMNNDQNGRSLLRSNLIEYFNGLQAMSAIQNFTAEDVTVLAGEDMDSVVINCYIQPVDSIEKIYITVNLA